MREACTCGRRNRRWFFCPACTTLDAYRTRPKVILCARSRAWLRKHAPRCTYLDAARAFALVYQGDRVLDAREVEPSLRQDGKPCFVRFGDPVFTRDGHSYNHVLKNYEAGVSVYPARWVERGLGAFLMGGAGYMIDLTDITKKTAIAHRTARWRPLFECAGAVLETRGFDWEPLLDKPYSKPARSQNTLFIVGPSTRARLEQPIDFRALVPNGL